MTDIAEWLRKAADNDHSFSIGAPHAAHLREAAAEIERLQSEIERLRVMYNDCIKDLREASE